jgi:hypothetical protein
MSLDLDDTTKAREAITTSITSASRMITDLLGSEQRPIAAGLLRRTAATIAPHVAPDEAGHGAPASGATSRSGP